MNQEHEFSPLGYRGAEAIYKALVAMEATAGLPHPEMSSRLVPVLSILQLSGESKVIQEDSANVTGTGAVVVKTVPGDVIWRVQGMYVLRAGASNWTFTNIYLRDKGGTGNCYIDNFSSATSRTLFGGNSRVELRMDAGDQIGIYVDAHTTAGPCRTVLKVVEYQIGGVQ